MRKSNKMLNNKGVIAIVVVLTYLLSYYSFLMVESTYGETMKVEEVVVEEEILPVTEVNFEDTKLRYNTDVSLDTFMDEYGITNIEFFEGELYGYTSKYKEINDEELIQIKHNSSIAKTDNYTGEQIAKNENKATVLRDLRAFPQITVADMNDYIRRVAPADSPFIDNGYIFIYISNELNIDPRYVFAHASIESGYGRSNMAQTKGNYFGIGAFNSNPSNALTFVETPNYRDSLHMIEGLYSGTKWIMQNYTYRGQPSLHSMIYGKKSYAVSSDGTPNEKWMYDISYIMDKY